jgi:hypothetical protein
MAVSETIPSQGKLFGIPLGELSLFSHLFMGVAFGVMVFFATCFFAIFGLLFYNVLGHHAVNLADAYRDVAFPVGVLALVAGVVVMFTMWLRHKLSRG